MSFILEALKKSETKRRKKSVSRSSRSIHEAVPKKNAKSRSRVLGISFVVLVIVVFMLWFFSPWRQPSSTMNEVSMSDSNQTTANFRESVSMQMNSVAPQNPPESMSTATPPELEGNNEKLGVKALVVPRSEKKIYNFDQLPISIQRQIPSLRMSLHAYNPGDAAASMVQLNDKIMHEKEMVAPNIHLEQISAAGIVLRYDGYRFLVPRRGN